LRWENAPDRSGIATYDYRAGPDDDSPDSGHLFLEVIGSGADGRPIYGGSYFRTQSEPAAESSVATWGRGLASSIFGLALVWLCFSAQLPFLNKSSGRRSIYGQGLFPFAVGSHALYLPILGGSPFSSSR